MTYTISVMVAIRAILELSYFSNTPQICYVLFSTYIISKYRANIGEPAFSLTMHRRPNCKCIISRIRRMPN